MSSPEKHDNKVYKPVSGATANIHALLQHVRAMGLDWVPTSFGIDQTTQKHVLSYIEGTVPHEDEAWIFQKEILLESATKLRQWHDAGADFKPLNDTWLLQTDEAHEVFCHNDFAPYNCVFDQTHKIVGIIDFDLCSPGSRLWDIAYTAYRFVPIIPDEPVPDSNECSPFSKHTILERLQLFLDEYQKTDGEKQISVSEVLKKLKKRLQVLANWSIEFGKAQDKKELIQHGRMYVAHSQWLDCLIT